MSHYYLRHKSAHSLIFLTNNLYSTTLVPIFFYLFCTNATENVCQCKLAKASKQTFVAFSVLIILKGVRICTARLHPIRVLQPSSLNSSALLHKSLPSIALLTKPYGYLVTGHNNSFSTMNYTSCLNTDVHWFITFTALNATCWD